MRSTAKRQCHIRVVAAVVAYAGPWPWSNAERRAAATGAHSSTPSAHRLCG
jgi:hypothetical protein